MAVAKKIIKLIVVVVILAVIVVGAGIAYVVTNIDSLAESGIERVMSLVLAVDVTVDEVDVNLKERSMTVRGFVVDNPEGFNTDHAFSVDETYVEADIKSFRTDEPVIKLIRMKSPNVTLEQTLGGSNIKKLIENAQAFQKRMGMGEKEEAEEAKKYVRIDRVEITDASASVSAPILQGQRATVPIPKITMTDVGGKKDDMTIADTIELFFKRLLKGVTKAGGDILPDELLGKLGASLKDVGADVGDLGGAALEGAERIKEEGADAIKEGGESVKKGVEDAAGAIEDLF